MKRINLSVDINDNEIFNEAIYAAIKSQSRQIVREEISVQLKTEIEETISAVIQRELNKLKDGTWYQTYKERTEKEIKSELIARLYQEIGQQILNTLKEEFVKKL